ncbi:MAG: HAMP domain-containing sensor histidine kinase [Sandaracinus sp.]
MGAAPRPESSWERFARRIGLDEVPTEAFREKLLGGIVTGYVTALLLLGLVAAVDHFGALPSMGWAYVLVGTKLVTNTLALAAWRARRLVTAFSALNITADVLTMTGTIYYTGGVLSPLVAIYFVEIAVMALLTNVGLTLTTTLGCFVTYALMAALTLEGWIPQRAPIVASAADITPAIVLSMIGFVAIVTVGPAAYVAIIVDSLRRKEAALARRAQDLVEASRAKSEFTANITHELRTPLHGILGLGELLVDGIYGPMTEKQIEAVKNIRRSASGQLELIDSLLVLARAEALKLEVQRGTVDVGEVIGSVVATGKMLVGARRLDVRADIQGELPRIETDRQKLVQILVNLLANAVKFTPDEGAVAVEARPDAAGVRIAVRDTGRGIPKDALGHVFEPYFQVDGSPVREHGGAGIGLSVVRTLAGVLGVTVTVESEVGRGSTFTLVVPLSPPSPGAAGVA